MERDKYDERADRIRENLIRDHGELPKWLDDYLGSPEYRNHLI